MRRDADQGELNRRNTPGRIAVGIVVELPGCLVVDDAVTCIIRSRAKLEATGGERCSGGRSGHAERLEDVVVQHNFVGAMYKVGEGVDIRTAEGGVKQEVVDTRATGQTVIPETAAQGVVTRASIEDVGSAIAREDVGRRISGQIDLAAPGGADIEVLHVGQATAQALGNSGCVGRRPGQFQGVDLAAQYAGFADRVFQRAGSGQCNDVGVVAQATDQGVYTSATNQCVVA